MSYEKKVIVLKQTESGFACAGKTLGGIVRIETENGVSTLFLSPVNFTAKPSGEYFLFVIDGSLSLYRFSLGSRPTSLTKTFDEPFSLKKGFAAGVCFINADIPILTAFQRTDDCDVSATIFKKTVAEKCMELRKQRIKDEEPPVYNMRNQTNNDTQENKTRENPKTETPDALSPYDDEAVATENFYDLDENDERFSDVLTKTPNANKNDTPSKNSSTDDCFFDEKKEKYDENNPFFLTVEKELYGLLEKFPEEDSLQKMIYGSKFVKINYSAKKYYVVGIIKEKEKEKYVCYGVPATYSKSPPKELDGYCSFIPISIFDLKGDGYWMMFQDAVTGECIIPK